MVGSSVGECCSACSIITSGRCGRGVLECAYRLASGSSGPSTREAPVEGHTTDTACGGRYTLRLQSARTRVEWSLEWRVWGTAPAAVRVCVCLCYLSV